MPVCIVQRLGAHGAMLAQWFAKRTPCDASRSRGGVRTSGGAGAGGEGPRHWSSVMYRTLPRGAMVRDGTAATGRLPAGAVELRGLGSVLDLVDDLLHRPLGLRLDVVVERLEQQEALALERGRVLEQLAQ